MKLFDICKSENIVPAPPRKAKGYNRLDSWGEEQIWGHRLWERQTPWLLFLEFLGIVEAQLREGQLFADEVEQSISFYCFHQRIPLRNILFNNIQLARINESSFTENVKWEKWLEWMNKECEPNQGLDFCYLKARFKSFSDLARTIDLLRKTSLEPDKNRRWSSQFIFPFGQHALYEDLSIKGNEAERQAINFGRTGDLLYKMISRSSKAEELRPYFTDLLTKPTVPDKLVAKLLPPEGPQADKLSEERTAGYLPYKKHPAYERLAEDWLGLLKLQMPAYDVYAHMVPMATLHVFLYEMETAAVWCKQNTGPVFVCEVVAPKMEFVRQCSIRSFLNNDGLPFRAMENFIAQATNNSEWESRINDSSLMTDAERIEEAKRYFDDILWVDAKELTFTTSLSELVESVLSKLHKKLEDNIGKIHNTYGRYCGLVSRRGTRNYRYAPTDTLLKTIVLANVIERMELTEFLKQLYQRYHFVFGPAEAKQALPPEDYDETPFKRNLERLEERLRSMGLLNRLSDGVAYVENSFATGR